MLDLLQQLDADLSTTVAQVQRSLVQITNRRPRRRVAWRGPRDAGGAGWEPPRSASGAGTIWHRDGLIITNAHVVKERSLQVTLADGRTLPARLLAHDADLDLAALAVEANDLPTIELGESTRLRAGELVLALGHPWGVTGAVTAGVVIGVGVARHPGALVEGGEWRGLRHADREWITASLRVRPGHSGGPLVDVQGRLVGINTIMAGPGVGVAVPVHVAKRFLKEKLGAVAAA